jgi:hypothetical protein
MRLEKYKFAAGTISIKNEKVWQQGGKEPSRKGGWSAGGGETIVWVPPFGFGWWLTVVSA